ncbi:MAG TPA: hypothetical protein VF778_05935 [Xanthobacteraceae bacterium]
MIIRTYGCEDCGNFLEVELRADQWDQEPPECPHCAERPMFQQFKPPAIGGSNKTRAADLALKIASEDYGVADIQPQGAGHGPPKVRYKDAAAPTLPSAWSAPNANLAQAVALGRESRLKYGSGLDVLHSTLKDGSQPDLIELSKRRSARIW